MGVLYTIWPLDPQMRDWLESQDIVVPYASSRWPTDVEIRDVLRDLKAFKVSYTENGRSSSWDAGIQSFFAEQLWTLLHAEPEDGNDSVTKLHFEKGDPLLIIAILRALAVRTGPLALIADTGDPPLVVTADTPFTDLVESFCEFDTSSDVWSVLQNNVPGVRTVP